jgi:hypothetical protein
VRNEDGGYHGSYLYPSDFLLLFLQVNELGEIPPRVGLDLGLRIVVSGLDSPREIGPWLVY